MTSRACGMGLGLRRVGLSWTLAAIAVVSQGACSIGFSSNNAADGPVLVPTAIPDGGFQSGADAVNPVGGASDAAAPPIAILGSSLCHASRAAGVCYPDDIPSAGQCLPHDAGGPAVADGGAYRFDAGAGADAGLVRDAGGIGPADASGPAPDAGAPAMDASFPGSDASADGSVSPGDADADAGTSFPDAALDASAVSDGMTPGIATGSVPGVSGEANGVDAGSAVIEACRVVNLGDGPGPMCEPAGHGTDGFSCGSSSDCAPEYDCVADPASKGAGVCRKYCCDYTCADGGATGAADRFCGIATVYTSQSLNIPVCLPVLACSLTEASSCAGGTTCSVVEPDGTTSCIPIGPGREGDQCETRLCDVGLACLGVTGSRTCSRLCNSGDAGACFGDAGGCCSAGQTCQTSQPLFPDPSVGICQP